MEERFTVGRRSEGSSWSASTARARTAEVAPAAVLTGTRVASTPVGENQLSSRGDEAASAKPVAGMRFLASELMQNLFSGRPLQSLSSFPSKTPKCFIPPLISTPAPAFNARCHTSIRVRRRLWKLALSRRVL